jgi:hypothetical protein
MNSFCRKQVDDRFNNREMDNVELTFGTLAKKTSELNPDTNEIVPAIEVNGMTILYSDYISRDRDFAKIVATLFLMNKNGENGQSAVGNLAEMKGVEA